jgi:hypothetical protein
MKRRMAFVFLLALTILAGACSKTKTTALPAAVDQHLAWIPQAVNGVAYFDVQSLRQSELGQALQKDWSDEIMRWRKDREFREWLERAGFDFEKDLHSVLAGFRGGRHDSAGTFAVVITGNFDEQKIANTIAAMRDSLRERHEEHKMSDLVTETYGGKTLYVIKERGEKAFYLADANTLVAGNKDWVQAVIDGKTAGESVKQNEALTALMNKLSYADQCWLVANTAESMETLSEEFGAGGEFKGTRAVKSLQSIALSAHVAKNADLSGEAWCDNEENSKLLTEAVKGALATAKLAVSDDREAVDMLNRIDVERAGKSVKFSAELDKAFFDKMREKAEGRRLAVAIR